MKEGARLERVLGNAMRVVLPKSGHTALLEVRSLDKVQLDMSAAYEKAPPVVCQ